MRKNSTHKMNVPLARSQYLKYCPWCVLQMRMAQNARRPLGLLARAAASAPFYSSQNAYATENRLLSCIYGLLQMAIERQIPHEPGANSAAEKQRLCHP
jgi:hypothetical protein